MNTISATGTMRSGCARVCFWAVFFVPTAAPGDEPPDLQRELTYIKLEEQKLGTSTLASLAVREQMTWWHLRTEEKKAQMYWLRAEARAFAKLSGSLDKDMDYVTHSRDDLRQAGQDAARFVNGNASRTSRHGFVKLVQLVGHTPEVRRVLAQEAPGISARDFQSHVFGGIVEATGELRPPPPTLIAGAGREFFDRFGADWIAVAADLRSEREVPGERLDGMRATVAQWRDWLSGAQEIPGPSELLYLDRCIGLLDAIADARGHLALTNFLKNRGHAFEGGTCGELLEYLLAHELLPRPGTQGHLVLGRLTNEMIEQAKAEAAVLERRLEELKSQSPAHNAVLRQRMVPGSYGGSQGGTTAGLDSPAFRKPAVPEAPLPPAVGVVEDKGGGGFFGPGFFGKDEEE